MGCLDVGGEAFESDTVLDNFSAGGLYVRCTVQRLTRTREMHRPPR